MEVLAPVFGTQKRGSNTGRVSSCTSSYTIWSEGRPCMLSQSKVSCGHKVNSACDSLMLKDMMCVCRLAVSAFQEAGNWTL